nr:MAG TPA_asm: hypothetical protein [Caudoviricetes sp.]
MIDYIVQELSLLTSEDIIVIALAISGFLLLAYMQAKNDVYEIYDYQKVVVSTLNYNTNERIDRTIRLDKEKTENEYILILSKKLGYFVSSHVCGDNIVIGTNVDKKCKPNDINVNTISLPNSVRILVVDPDN